VLLNLARFYADHGNSAQAEPLYRRALAIDEKALSHDTPQFATDLNNLASASTDVGNYAVAEALYKRALQIQLRALGPENPDVAVMLDGLAFLYQKLLKSVARSGELGLRTFSSIAIARL
jgi:tetratricopeptide (TPR) repeat protein